MLSSDAAPELLQLPAMADRPPDPLPAWEAEWTLFGPIPNEGHSGNWPGQIAWQPLPLDAATQIPSEVEILGQVYAPVSARSKSGLLDFAQVFGPFDGCPIVYAMLQLDSPAPARLPIAFGANWGTEWWMNGELVYETRVGNFGDPLLRNSHQFEAPLRAGRNLLVVRVISGGPPDWTLLLGQLPPRPGTTAGPLPLAAPILPPERAHSRDYLASGLRIEERPGPVPAEVSRRRAAAMSEHGVQAHWVGIVDPTGSPYGASEVFPQRPEAQPEDEALLREQISRIHEQGMSAVTWFPGTHCRTAAQAHPDWAVVPFGQTAVQVGESFWNLCPSTPYGEALIEFTLESLANYDLDGFWFDGSSWSHEGKIGCSCEHCRRRFREDEGLDFPGAADWSDPAFRRWVQWRYRTHMDYWGRLAARVRREFPRATIVVNHLHRLRSSWFGAIPVDRYPAPVLVGTEAMDSPFESAFHARLVRAYGKPHDEVWMGLHKLFQRTPFWLAECDPVYRYLHHALATITAGSWPSFGTPDPGETLTTAYDLLGSVVNPRRPYAGGQPEPYLGLHLSQQSETFFFSRHADWGHPLTYWESLYGWNKLLCEKQLLTQIVFDAELNPNDITRYPVFLAPLSVALSEAQVRVLHQYVQAGGVLVVGPGFAACDEWGETADPARRQGLLEATEPAASAAALLEAEGTEVKRWRVGRGQVLQLSGNAGLAFHRYRSATLADEVAALLTAAAPPRVVVQGPRRLHVGLFRQPGRLYLHLQNFIAWSEAGALPDPAVTAPEPARDVRVTLHGLDVSAAFRVLLPGRPEVALSRSGASVSFTLPVVEWGDIVELRL